MEVFSQLRHIRRPLWQIKGKLAFMVLLTLGTSFIALLPPYFSKLIFDKGVASRDIGRILYYGSLALVSYLLATILRFGAQVLFAQSSNRFAVKVKEQALGRLIRTPLEFFDKKQTGYWTKRLNEVDSLSGLFSPTIFRFFSSLIQFGGALGIMIGISGRVTLVMLIFLPFFFLITYIMSGKLKVISQKLMETSATTRGNLQEAISAAPEIKQFTAEDRKTKEITRQFSSVAKNRIKQSITSGMGTQSLGFLTQAAGVVVLVLSGIYIAQGQLTMGDYVALAGYAGKLFVPLQLFGSLSLTLQPVLVALKRLSEIFEERTEQKLWGDKQVQRLEGNITFKDLYFTYGHSDGYVLSGCSFSLRSGDCVALLGKNGAGKSTLVKLLLGFYPDYSGEILVDNLELHNYNITSLRKRVGIVSQDILLFSGTIEDNVKLADPEAPGEVVERTLALSGCQNVFEGEPGKVRISESGKNLSGGQKQVVAIARCLLKDPDLLIFDEATAHLDAITRNIVLDAFKNKFTGKTRILITQDEKISEMADRVFFLEDGKVHENNL